MGGRCAWPVGQFAKAIQALHQALQLREVDVGGNAH